MTRSAYLTDYSGTNGRCHLKDRNTGYSEADRKQFQEKNNDFPYVSLFLSL